MYYTTEIILNFYYICRMIDTLQIISYMLVMVQGRDNFRILNRCLMVDDITS